MLRDWHEVDSTSAEAILCDGAGDGGIDAAVFIREDLEEGIEGEGTIGYAASPLKQHLQQGKEPPPVWPYAQGSVRGYSYAPLHKNVSKAALADPHLYELLVLVDALRDGKAREREIAVKELTKRLQGASDGLSKP